MMQAQIDDLQARLAFQDDAIQEMLGTLVDQQKQIYELREMMTHLHKQMNAMTPSQLANADEETPPPHY